MATLDDLKALLGRIAEILLANEHHFTDLDQELGDGDMGITMAKIARVLQGPEVQQAASNDIGTFLFETGMATNRAAASTMGTLVSTALMEAGKAVKGETLLTDIQIAKAFKAGALGIQKRGKAQLGDKTILDALLPAVDSFEAAIAAGVSCSAALGVAATQAVAGRDAVTPLRSKMGRAGWVGDRTIGKTDPGCEMAALVLQQLDARQVN